MLPSIALIFLAGLALAALSQRLKLPRIIGMLLAGVLLGPYALNLLDPSILNISAELRQMALVIILLRAGLSLDLADLKKVGRPAVLMSCVPASFEILGYFLLAPLILHISRIEAAVMGAVLSAVSPAVVVPRMIRLMETKRGTSEGIPQMILAGASCDDVFVIVLFSTFTGMAQGGTARILDFVNIPLSIFLGFMLGAAAGWLLNGFFQGADRRGKPIEGNVKTLLLLSCAFLLLAVENVLKGKIPLSGILAVMSMACVLKRVGASNVTKPLSSQLNKLWFAAEILLFVLVGAAVDIRYTLEAGPAAVLLLFLALAFRAVGVLLSVSGTTLRPKERLFCVIAYLPKATVQAAIGSAPLAMGLPCGKIVLSVSVLGILFTAPLGAFGIDAAAPRLLRQSEGLREKAV